MGCGSSVKAEDPDKPAQSIKSPQQEQQQSKGSSELPPEEQQTLVVPDYDEKKLKVSAIDKPGGLPRQVSVESSNSTRYRAWTTKLSCELQEAVDKIFAKEAKLGDLSFSLTIADPMLEGCPLIGCSTGFGTLCGYEMEEIVGRNCRFLVDPVPKNLIDWRTRDRSREFCTNVKTGKHHDVKYEALSDYMPTGAPGELFCSQMNARKDGSHFNNMFYMIAVELDEQPYIIGLQTELIQEEEYMNTCQEACKVLRNNMGQVEKMLAAKFWFSGPMRRQDVSGQDQELCPEGWDSSKLVD